MNDDAGDGWSDVDCWVVNVELLPCFFGEDFCAEGVFRSVCDCFGVEFRFLNKLPVLDLPCGAEVVQHLCAFDEHFLALLLKLGFEAFDSVVAGYELWLEVD